MNVHEFVFEAINGAPMPLSNWQGQPVLLTNTASESAFTPQYRALEHLWMDYREGGLIVIGVPCNDFDCREPGNEKDIAAFCAAQYRVSFPLTAKYALSGHSAHPLVHAIREEFGEDATPQWNFYKYLFDRNGQLVDFWPSEVLPGESPITHKIECNLQSWIL